MPRVRKKDLPLPAGAVRQGPLAPNETRPQLRHVTFKADPKTLEALKRLEALVQSSGGVVGARSIALRRAILTADALLRRKIAQAQPQE